MHVWCYLFVSASDFRTFQLTFRLCKKNSLHRNLTAPQALGKLFGTPVRIEIAMKLAFITACVLAFAGPSGLQGQGVEPLATAPEQSTPDGRFDLQTSTASPISEMAKPAPTVQGPEATGLASPSLGGSSRAAASAKAQEERRTTAEVRRVRAAVERTLRRTQEMFRTASH
jgi:hypothetical protein